MNNSKSMKKPSGIEWIGEIPEEWQVIRLKYIGESIIGLTYSPNEITTEGGILVLRSSNIQEKKLCFDDNVYVDKDIPQRLIVKSGDIVICSRNGSSDLIGKCTIVDKENEGCTFGAFMTVFRSKYNRFIEYVFNSTIFEYQKSSFLTTTVNQLTIGNLNNFIIALPPLPMQQTIINYLDKKCSEIDKVIEDKQKQNVLLKDHRKAVIYEAVTGKLAIKNDNLVTQSSDIEWIGDIPKSWKIKKLKYVCEIDKHKLSDKTDSDFSFNYIDISSVTEYGGIGETEYMQFEESPSRARMIVNRNDIIVSTVRTYLKAIAQVSEDDKYIASTGFAVLSPKDCIDSKYAFYQVTSEYFVQEVVARSQGVSYPAITSTALSNIKFIVPPLPIQQDIAEYLDQKCAEIDRVVENNNSIIDNLKEYRQSVICEVVTGKITIN